MFLYLDIMNFVLNSIHFVLIGNTFLFANMSLIKYPQISLITGHA